MKIFFVFLCSLLLTIGELHDVNSLMKYLKRNGVTDEMVTSYLNNMFHPIGINHGSNHYTYNGGSKNPWTNAQGQKFIETLHKEYDKHKNPAIDVRFGFNDENPKEDDKEDFSVSKNNKESSKELNRKSEVNHKSTISTKNNVKQCIKSVTHVKGKQMCKDQLIFNENFESIRKNIWNIDQKIAGAPDYEFVVYVDRAETREIMRGASINIKPVLIEDIFGPKIFEDGIDLGKNCTEKTKPQDCKMKPDAGFMVPPIASAQMNTKNKFSFRYGFVEIRAKLPAGDWIYPILYLNPMRELYGKLYESGQIRIAFTEGNEINNQELKGGIILGLNTKARNYGMRNITRMNRWSDTFHKYQLKWTPESFFLSVDGIEYGIIEPPIAGFVSLTDDLKIPNSEDWRSGSPLAPFDKEMYLQVGVGVGGFNFDDRLDGSKPWRNGERLQVKKFYEDKDNWLPSWKDGKNTLNIDYIKIWAL